MGMTYEDYWLREPNLVKSYRKAYEIRREEINNDLWLQGLYFYRAINASLSAALGGKNSNKLEYFEYPIPFTEHEKEMDKQRKTEKTREWFMKGQNG